MDQELCEIENDTPMLIDSETDNFYECLSVEETINSLTCDTETETSTKEIYPRNLSLLDKAYSIDDAILATPLEPTPVQIFKTIEKSSTDESTSEEDFVVIVETAEIISHENNNCEVKIMPDDFDVFLESGDSNLIDISQACCLRKHTPYTSILRRPSFFDNDSVPDPSDKPRVSFPNAEIMVSYKEPDDLPPWNIDSGMSSEKILQVYQNSCKKYNTIELDSIKEQIQEIKNNTNHSATLNLASVNITSEVNETLEELLQVSNFNTLILNDCKFTPATITEFLNMLEFYESVCNIEVRMKFDEETWKCFCNACGNIEVLESISFKEITVNDSYMRPLIHTVNRNKNITILKFDTCLLDKLPSFYLVECLISNKSIQELYIPSTGLYTKEADVLGRFLILNTYLKVLDISNNFIGDRGLEVLAKGLCKQDVFGCGLSVLVVFNNQITEKSGPCISNIIKTCKNLHTLNLGFNNLTDEVLIHISDGLPDTSSLEGLGLQSTLLTCKGIQVLAEALQKNSTLRKINLKGNKAIQITGVERLCQVLAFTKITKIEIDETNRSCNEDDYKELVKQINEICTINRSLPTNDEVEVANNISKMISRKVSLSCDLRHVEVMQASLLQTSSPAPKTRFSISKVSESSRSPKNRFKVSRVPPSPEEDEPCGSGKFANVRSSVSSNDSMDSLTALPLDTDSDEH
ncbi:unnamed protein product [Brassicogethes aeneus]|uniref:Protein phosphatase 1 regulatory subunit 37 n=1 Tax=Brassicogethes aeneus TaxID=1431903 RepID=A0A9P0BBX6_BRAAE|nr:unnamed protein product [Brassicogethes aeneus]